MKALFGVAEQSADAVKLASEVGQRAIQPGVLGPAGRPGALAQPLEHEL